MSGQFARWSVPTKEQVEEKMNEPQALVPLNERELAKLYFLFLKHDPTKKLDELFEYHHNLTFREKVLELVNTDPNVLQEENKNDAIELLKKACADLGANPVFYTTLLEHFGLNA